MAPFVSNAVQLNVISPKLFGESSKAFAEKKGSDL